MSSIVRSLGLRLTRVRGVLGARRAANDDDVFAFEQALAVHAAPAYRSAREAHRECNRRWNASDRVDPPYCVFSTKARE